MTRAARCSMAAWGLASMVLTGCTPKPETVLVVASISAVDADGEPAGDL